MYFPPSIRTRIISLFFLIQYTMANDSGLQTIYQEDNSDALSITDNALLAISGPSQFTTPFTSGGASSTSELQNPNPQDDNGPDSLRLSNDNCHSAAEQPYPSRRRRKRQNEKTFCDSPAPGASNQPENSNGITNSNPKTQNSAPARTPNGVPTPPPELDERLHNFLYSVPGWDGKPNPAACNNPDYPLFQVPICAPQVNPSVGRTSPASFVAPCKFMPPEGCNKAIEESWCCLMARETDHAFMSTFLRQGEVVPDTILRYPASGLSCVQVSAIGA